MKTDDLIRALAQDAGRPRVSMPARLGLAIAAGGIVAVALFVLTLGVRPDLAAVASAWRFQFKVAVPVVAFVAAFWGCLELSRPDCAFSRVLPVLLVGPLLVLAGVATELALTPAASWKANAIGHFSGQCLVAIPSLSAASLVAAIAVMRHGAPRSPTLAGGAAGLLAATLSAGIYATHCPDDSPLFFALWYVLAIGVVVVAGLIAGRPALRW